MPAQEKIGKTLANFRERVAVSRPSDLPDGNSYRVY